MSDQTLLQKKLFTDLKDQVDDAKTTLVDELATLLNVSTDSAYRRIRCDKFITIDELEKICSHFDVSFDKYLSISKADNVMFTVALDHENITFESFIGDIQENVKNVAMVPDHRLVMSAKEIPFFHFFQIPELAAFKVFYWMKTLFHMSVYEDVKFDFNIIDKKYIDMTTSISNSYLDINSKEIWNFESIHSMLSQVEFYYESSVISQKVAFVILDKVELLVKHIKKQADLGFKFPINSKPDENKKHNFDLYYNEIILSDNTIFVDVAGHKKCYLPHASLYYMSTVDKKYCDHFDHLLKGIIKKSTMISGSAEKHRNIFFNYMLNKIEQYRTKISL